MQSVELFAGAGGLAIGMANAGFHHAAVVERDHHACETFRCNQLRYSASVERWPLHEVDARKFDFSSIKGGIAVVSGGPPCQPFSISGKHKGRRDNRDMFPEAVRAIRELRPKAFIFENVKGLMRESFETYFSYIQLQLQYPELERRKYERWSHHLARLEKRHTGNKAASTYHAIARLLNAADYGVPQHRERVFIVGFRSDLGIPWSFPEPTHTRNALVHAKWVAGSYWDEHKIPTRRRPEMPSGLRKRLPEITCKESVRDSVRWRTVRDALRGLPDPELGPVCDVSDHLFVPGARKYVGHTGSALDEPAKTLKAGHHGVPGGENMFIKDDGTVRYFTVREAARIQTFPDEFEFKGSWTQTMRQLGNAVPVRLAEVIAGSVMKALCKKN